MTRTTLHTSNSDLNTLLAHINATWSAITRRPGQQPSMPELQSVASTWRAIETHFAPLSALAYVEVQDVSWFSPHTLETHSASATR